MAFGWSATDVLAALNFIVDAAQALDDSEGAGKDFRQASAFLHHLDQALKPLQTFEALEATPEYKAQIETQVVAIRAPIETFMKDVEGMAKQLGVPAQGRFRRFKNVHRKWEWHYFTSKKAIALQKEIERHLNILDTLMQQLLLDLVDRLPKTVKADMTDTVNEALMSHLSRLQPSIVDDLSQRNESSRDIWLQQLEDMLERYLGSQRLILVSPVDHTPMRRPIVYSGAILYTRTMLKAHVSHLVGRFNHVSDETHIRSVNIDGLSAGVEVTYHLQSWWASEESAMLWIQGSSQSRNEWLAGDIVAMARQAKVPVLAYFCERFGPDRDENSQADLLIDLVYALIYQLVDSVTADFSSSLDFGHDRFALLNGSLASLSPALSLLQDLISLKFGRLLIVLDGLHLLDYSHDEDVERSLQELFRILNPAINSGCPSSSIIKTLVTTDEPTLMLEDEVEPRMIVDATKSLGSGGLLAVSDFQTLIHDDSFALLD